MDTTEETLKVLFYRPSSFPSWCVSCATLSPVAHVAVSLCGVIYNSTVGQRTAWAYPEQLSAQPSVVASLRVPISVTVLDRLLPKGERYPLLSTISSWAVGYPKYPLSCVGATKRALLLAGAPVKGRTPYGIYRELRRREGVEWRGSLSDQA